MSDATLGRWTFTDYETRLLVGLSVFAGVMLIVVRSYGGVIQLHPAKFIPLPIYGAALLVLGLVMATRHLHPQASRWAVRLVSIEMGWLAACNLGEAVHLGLLAIEHPNWDVSQLGWIGAGLWGFAALTGVGIARSNEQRT